MKFFAFDENLERQQKKIMARLRQLMNGETSHQLQVAGLNYKKAYGVSLVHLRQLSKEYHVSNKLAERLWFRNVRETMILATLLAQPDDLTDEQIFEWTNQITNIELAEQVAFNMLGRKKEISSIVEKWMLHPVIFVRYTALMAIGWHFRFNGNSLTPLIISNLGVFDALSTDKLMVRAVAHCLKMAGRFNPDLTAHVTKLASQWSQSHDAYLQQAGFDILDEIQFAKT